jgi:hypothetical protein
MPNNSHGIKLSFSPQRIELPLSGSNQWQLQITTPNSIPSNNYSLKIDEWFQSISGSIGGATKYPLFDIEVLKPRPVLAQVFESLRQFLTPQIAFGILLVVILAITLPLLYVWKKVPVGHNLIGLARNDILQINATVIAGVLVLLTLGTALIHVNATEISLIVASIIIPFAVSSILVVMSKAPEHDKVLKFFAS